MTAQTPAETERDRLIAALGDLPDDGYSLTCVAEIDTTEAIRRLRAEPLTPTAARQAATAEDVFVLAATTVPGGCVLFQPWAYGASMPGVMSELSINTTCYGMYANPKSGHQGSLIADGVWLGSDLFPGGGPDDDYEENTQLLERLYEFHPIAYCFAYVDLKPTDARSITGPPDTWLRLPDNDYWAV
ncbi:hypothetical protein ACFFQW_28075 [Umezawaea endophytica]|uniref:Uncharacterized protein n=1 Tax=Umezawaea endophytica TaxID=1654476 RepID=A0A9X2VQR9_9PSEU|nr:hypothetical protein [Umezawaea endophytica]MCS7480889.1 hypothetical protein [Umezawaea endophytica]